MTIRVKLGILFCFLLLTGCDYSKDQLTDEFELSWVDSEDFRTLRYKNEGVGVGFTHKVGYNEKFIIVLGELESGEKAYYIIDIHEYKKKWGDQPDKQGRFGPYSKKQFDNHLKKVGQSKLKFTQFYEKSH